MERFSWPSIKEKLSNCFNIIDEEIQKAFQLIQNEEKENLKLIDEDDLKIFKQQTAGIDINIDIFLSKLNDALKDKTERTNYYSSTKNRSNYSSSAKIDNTSSGFTMSTNNYGYATTDMNTSDNASIEDINTNMIREIYESSNSDDEKKDEKKK